jgi:hypothetical protein
VENGGAFLTKENETFSSSQEGSENPLFREGFNRL